MALARYADIVSRLSILGVDKSIAGLTRFQTGLMTMSAKAAIAAKSMLMFGGAMAVALGGATVAAARFEKQMAMVSTMLTDNVGPTMKKFRKGVLSMSKEFGESTATLSKGMYDILSATIPVEKVLRTLEIAAKGAAAGFTTTDVTVKVLAKTMLAFKDLEPERIMDVLSASVERGFFTFEELAGAMPGVIALGKELNVSFVELSGTVAYLSKAFPSVTEAATGLEGLMKAMVVGTKDVRDKFEAMGTSIEEVRAKIGKEGLYGTIEWLIKLDAGRNLIGSLFRRKEALLAMAAMRRDMEAWGEDLGKVFDSIGVTQKKYEQATDTLDFKVKRLKQTFLALAVSIGDPLLPIVKNLTEKITKLTGKFDKLDESVKKNIVTKTLWVAGITLVIGVVAGLIVVVAKATAVIQGAVIALQALIAMTVALTAPLWAVVAAATAVSIALGKITWEAGKLVKAYLEQKKALEGAAEVLAKFNEDSEEHLAIIKKASKYTVEDVYGNPDKIRDVRRAISVLTVMTLSHDKAAADVAKRQRDRMKALLAGYEEIQDKDTETAIVMIDNAKKVAKVKETAAEQERKAFDELFNYRRMLGLADVDDAIRHTRIKLAQAKAGSEEEADLLRQLYDLKAEKIVMETEQNREKAKEELDSIKERIDKEHLHYREKWRMQERTMELEKILAKNSEEAQKKKLEGSAKAYEAELKGKGIERKKAEETKKAAEYIKKRERPLSELERARMVGAAPARIEREMIIAPVYNIPETDSRKLAKVVEDTVPDLIRRVKERESEQRRIIEKEIDRGGYH